MSSSSSSSPYLIFSSLALILVKVAMGSKCSLVAGWAYLASLVILAYRVRISFTTYKRSYWVLCLCRSRRV